MKRILSIFLSLPLILIVAAVLIVNIRIFNSTPGISSADGFNNDLIKELRGLKLALQNHADEDMQKVYPEGYLFVNSLYGLAWCNLLQSLKSSSHPLYNEGHAEIQHAWDKINSETGRAPFSEDLPLTYGAFYTGWSTYLLGKKLSIEEPLHRNQSEVILFKRQCARIDSALSKFIYPVSYYRAAWPADGVICAAALALHDKLFPDQYTTSLNHWVNKLKTKTDHYGLIPHAINPANETSTQTARGSSQSLMLIFLREIDSAFANEQFIRYKENFLYNKIGLTGIREYPKDEYGFGDIDSGPVILQFGSSATIVGMQTLQLYGENESAAKIKVAIEGFGFSIQNSESKIYLFGMLPMADAFIAWGHSTMPVNQTKPDFITFHLYSLGLLIIMCILLWLWFRPKKPSSEKSLHIPW